MQNTTNYGLKKPESVDYININDFNENADIIDTQLKENADGLTTHKNETANQFAQQAKEIAYLKVNQEAPVTNTLKVIKSNKDSEGIFTKVTYKRKKDDTTYCVSTLSGGTTPLYTTKTEQYYDATGTNVIATHTYKLSYDEDENLISEV